MADGQVGSWLARMRESGKLDRAKAHASEGIKVIRHTGESAVTGALLGVVGAKNNGSLDIKDKVPADLVVGAVAALGAVAMPELAGDFTAVSNVGIGVFTMRMTARVLAKQAAAKPASPATKAAPGRAAAGARPKGKVAGDDVGADDVGADDVGADPIIEAAQKL